MNREKELLLRMAGTIVTIVICLAAMGFSAFAYFSHSISSGMNVIQAAHFDVVVTLKDVRDASKEVSADDTGEQNADEGANGSSGTNAGAAEENSGELKGSDTEAAGGSTSGSAGEVLAGNRLDNCEAKIYTFEIKVAQDAQTAQTGYCKIVIKKPGVDQQVYYTTQLYLHPDTSKGQMDALTIEIDMTSINNESGYSIEFIPQWGTSSHYAAQEKLLGKNDWFVIPFAPATSTDEDLAGSDEGVAGDGDGSQTESESASDEGEEVYTIVAGDTLYSIAQRYGLDWHELAEYNQIPDETKIVPGQVLKIPQSKGEEESEEMVENATEATTESAGEVAP